MYINLLLDEYKKSMNYVQDKQIAHDLGISTQKLTDIRKGRRFLTENETLTIARAINIDTETAFLYLAADKAKTYEAQQSWAQLIKKHVGQNLHMISMVCMTSLITVKQTTECALCILC